MIRDDRLGHALRTLREHRKWSLDYVAEICATSGPNLSKIERGQPKEYRLDLLSKLAAAYGLQTYELFALAENVDLSSFNALSRDEVEILRAFRNMPFERRAVAKATIETLAPPT